MNKKKKIIVLSIICILFLSLLALAYTLYKKTESEKDYVEEVQEQIPEQMSVVTEYDIFFSIGNNLNQYLKYLQDQNADAIYSLLSKEFIEEYEITPQNVLNYLDQYEQKTNTFQAKSMYYKSEETKYLFYVKGDIIEDNYETSSIVKENVLFLVSADYQNLTYSVYPLEYEITSNLPVKCEDITILPNEYNEFLGSGVITKEYICNLYLSDFYTTIIKNPSKTYELLQKKFRTHTYPKKKDYLSFLEENQEKFTSQILYCDLAATNTPRIYKITDLNYNTYTFTEERIMKYKVEFSLFHEENI